MTDCWNLKKKKKLSFVWGIFNHKLENIDQCIRKEEKIFAVCQFCGLLPGWKEKGETRDEHLENELAIIPYGRSEGMKLMGSSSDAQMCSPRQ